ncbi:asparagine synthase (glutamine-hydrolyzing) [Streptomyces sp. LP05-1]|uniref:asparagine synthase (glutamine-hydrolyzing) n=1 Tax=Streptomyces pyxinae TaxID=2970734 RepID=A0ABT2CEG4_9ACTN|nr:asparagine synthase (glutamine-hydrolyzing) [Streptomyces sp. LP05-1]MCS0635803.1 asparagine synthase (glutamine-hydrolyzing) [Streptomyces sp. LP05-1]
MCRIHGYFGADLAPTALDAARDAQLAGGPDQQHSVRGDRWGLGCNRLAIQDPAHGRQPFTNTDGSVHAVFNGEIYNFRAIREELAAHGVRVAGDSDGSVLVPYYELHGDRFTDRLDGMYAIALVDLRGAPRLKLWCDPLAVKSLYYAADGPGVVFASEPAGLTALRSTPSALDPLAVDHYLNWQCLPPGSSWLAGVSTLGPGEGLVHDGERLTVRRPPVPLPPVAPRAEPAGSVGGVPGGPPDAEHTPEGLRALLTREVEQMSLQTAPVAVQVSGGLDSAVLATLLARRRPDVTGFHVTHEGSHATDEESYAREAAAHAGIPLEVVEIREAELPELIPAMVAALGTPNATPHALSAYVLFREIHRSGFRVCFTGDGADEQFGGYRRYSTALAAPDPDRTDPTDPTDRTDRADPAGRTDRRAWTAWADRYLDRLSLLPYDAYRRLCTPGFRALADSGANSRERARRLLARPAPSRLEQLLEFDRSYKLPGLNLRKLDQLAMAHAVEGRVPYCQPSVTRFARGTPDALKVAGSRRKGILWDAGAPLIPRAVRDRPKQPFTFPVGAFLRPGGKLWDFVMDVLARPRLCAAGILDAEAVRAVLTEHADGRDHARLLWGLMVLELSLP